MLALPPLALALVLVAACAHAGWNLILHETTDRIAAVAVAGLATGVVFLPLIIAQAPWRVLPLVLLSAAGELPMHCCSPPPTPTARWPWPIPSRVARRRFW